MISYATVAAARSYGRLVHLWLPADADEAHQTLVDLSRGSHHQASTDYDSGRFHDVVGKSGGFSHHPTGGAAPDKGWMVSYEDTGNGTSVVHHLSDLQPEHIEAHRQAVSEHLKEPNTYQGGWLDKGTGEVYLDVSKHFPEEHEQQAREFALDQKQKAYYHLASGEEHYLHPQHDPKMLEDFDSWGKKYHQHLKDGVPQKYRSYEHLYPASEDLQHHLHERDERLASVERTRRKRQFEG